MSILSYPDRGRWGSAKWPGNCSGHVARELVERVRPTVFLDAMTGSGSAAQAAADAGVEHVVALDLHMGFDCLRMPLIERLPEPSQLSFLHPPYGSMLAYSGTVWGDAAHPNDLSHALDDDDFFDKLERVMHNLRDATAPAGTYTCLIGDWRRGGSYVSYQAELIARMPRKELAAVLIKQQHNCTSDARRYGAMRWPRITHEYLMCWVKPSRTSVALQTLAEVANQHARRLRSTWRAMVHLCLVKLGGRASLPELYAKLSEHAPERVREARHWQSKARQTLQLHPEFEACGQGVWKLA